LHEKSKSSILADVHEHADKNQAIKEELEQLRDKMDERFKYWEKVNEANIRARYLESKTTWERFKIGVKGFFSRCYDVLKSIFSQQ